MPPAKRQRRDPNEDWEQLRMLVATPAQEAYELLRPIVLFGRTPAERANETGVPERTLRRHADRFDAAGMASLFATPAAPANDRRALPAEIRQAIVDLKAEYPALNLREIATICAARFHRPVSHHTVQSVLASALQPTSQPRRFPLYREIADPVERRLAVVRLYLEGWNIKSIAGYLATTRPRVYDVLRRWFAEGLPGLDDHSRAPKYPARKVDLKALAAIRRLQANPELGGFRVSAALEQRGIFLSPRTCRRILALHRDLGAARRVPTKRREPRQHPFAATRRHQIWSVDIRYIEDHGLDTTKPKPRRMIRGLPRSWCAETSAPIGTLGDTQQSQPTYITRGHRRKPPGLTWPVCVVRAALPAVWEGVPHICERPPMPGKTLIPDAAALHLEGLRTDDDTITVVVTTTGDGACCPDCGRPSAALHRRRRRPVADLPWQGACR